MQNDNTLIRHTCMWCGETFWAKRPDALYDKNRCRQAASRWRKRLPFHAKKAIAEVQAIAQYLTYPDARSLAVYQLKVVKQEILDIYRIAGIREVK
jgi:hypothetical protein